MKFKFFSTIICFVLLLSCIFTSVSADTSATPKEFISGIHKHKTGVDNPSHEQIQDWIDGELTENAGITSEWYIIALSKSGDYDFAEYKSALDKYLSENTVGSASSRLKYSLTYMAIGCSDDEYLHNNVDSSIGQQGIMSWVFGLHILNNGFECDSHHIESVKEQILSMQLEDGGWAVMGSKGDVDVTAMAIQALSPYYSEAKVKSSIDKAISFLADEQQECGGFINRGAINLESASQVMQALASIGIDCKEDQRFIKNGKTFFDVIAEYQKADGSFSHTIDGESNGTATMQAYYSSVSYLLFKDGKSSFYIFYGDTLDIADESSASESSDNSEKSNSEDISESEAKTENEKVSYKVWCIIGIVLISGIAVIVLFITKKAKKQNLLIVCIIAVIAVIIVCATNFQTVDEYYSDAEKPKENIYGTITISISCETLIGKADEAHIPSDGIILKEVQCEIEKGDTVFDVISEITAKNKIHMETNGNADMAYIQGIGNIYEFDFGELSGWMYFVNGKEASVGCGEYILQPNDKIEWKYTCEMGADF